MSEIKLAARNAGLAEMREVLEDQRARAIDLIAPPQKFISVNGQIVITGHEPLVTDDGVTDPNGTYSLTGVGDEGLCEKLGIPRAYLRRMRDEGRLDLFDGNVNGWLHGDGGQGGYDKNLMLRMLRGDETGTGIVRAVLSDKYARIDNLDVLVAALTGVRDAGIGGHVSGCDLTERRMYVTIQAPEVKALAPVLLAGYKSPFGPGGIERIRELAAREGQGYEPGQEPVVFAGIRITNSETGNGRFSVAPHLTIKICGNGLTIGKDAMQSVHLGGRQEEGVIEWSQQTSRKALELVASKAADAVRTFLSPEYVAAKVAELEEAAGTKVTNPQDTIKQVVAKSSFPKEVENDIFAAFIAGGQLTAGGVMQAVTAAAQTVEDADIAALMESEAVNVLAHAARIG